MSEWAMVELVALAVIAALAGALLLEVRKCSKALVVWLQASERHLATLTQEAVQARSTWERLASRLEAGCEPLIQLGAATRAVSDDVKRLRDRYQEGALSVARKVGGTVEVLKILRSLFRPKGPRGAPSLKENA